MALATFEAYFSRSIAPTRRISLGTMHLPSEPSPGFGGVLLGGIMARFVRELDAETDEALDDLIDDLEAGVHVGQPRLRHRLQGDRIGLARCRHRLVADGEGVRFYFESNVGTPTQHVIAAAYAANDVDPSAREAVFVAVRKGLQWIGPIDESLVRYLTDRRFITSDRGTDRRAWAREQLGIFEVVARDQLVSVVSKAFREQILLAHPDSGGSAANAAQRISELREARHILMEAT